MEKDIFNLNLNSLMGESETPIEVEGTEDNFVNHETFFEEPEQSEEASKKQEDVEKELGLINLDEEEKEKGPEDEEEDLAEDNQGGEPSSETKKEADASTSSPLTPYAKLLKDEGILPDIDLEKFDGSADTLKEAMYNQVVSMVEGYKETLPPRVKNLIDNYEEGVPLEKLLEIDAKETDIMSITDHQLVEDVELQRDIVKRYLKESTKFSNSKIDSIIDHYDSIGELEEEAKASYAELKNSVEEEKTRAAEEARRMEEEHNKMREQSLRDLSEKIEKTKEIIPEMELNDAQRKSLYSSMTTPVAKDQHGNPLNRIVAARMENPMEFELKLHYLFDITKGFSDFSKLTSKGKKDSVKEFEQAIENIDSSSSSSFSARSAKGSPQLKEKVLSGILKQYNIK